MRRSIHSRRGIVVISTLLISTVLLILVVTLLLSISNENQLVLRNAHTTEALFLAEAGIADATYQLSIDNSWAPDDVAPLEVVFPDGNGKYTIVFNPDPDNPVEPWESVNNLSGDAFVNGPRGLDTVPPKTAHVVVTAEIKGREIRYEALISRGFSEPTTVPLLSAGKIRMNGDVVVRGVESLSNPVAIDAGIHSNNSAPQAGIIEWDGGGTGEAYISGEVTTTSNHPGAIQASGGSFNPGGVEEGAPAHSFPYIDIDAAIASGKNAPIMMPSGGGTTSLSGSNYRWDGGVINGDLVLDGVNLFVNGDLEVNGTIKGTGAIYVSGNTSFRGTANLVADQGYGMGVFSKGHVKLEGFDGSQYLESIAASNPTDFGKWFGDAKTAHVDLVSEISSGTYAADATDVTATWGNQDNSLVDQLRAVLGGGDTETLPTGIDDGDALGLMADYLETNYAGNESADFMIDRLRDTRTLYADGGLLDQANDGYDPSDASKASSRSGNQNFDKLGTSYFQGLIYTTGAVYASNEVEIVGALLADRNGFSPQGQWSVNGESLKAGDVFLTGGSSLVFNQELVEDPLASVPSGPVSVCSWLGR